MRLDIIEQDIQSIIEAVGSDLRKLEGATVLLTGAAGFLGTYFLAIFQFLNNKKILANPCMVMGFDNYISGSKKGFLNLENDKHIILRQGDVTKPIHLDKKIDYVIHAAGIPSPSYYQKFPLETIEVAVIGTKNMLEFARAGKVRSFLFFSSSEVYGDPHSNYIPTPETYRGNVSSTGPRACYDESKRLGETLCSVFYRLYSVPVKIVRPFNVYGPGMRLDDLRVIPTFFANAFLGNPLPVHDKGNQTRTFCYISDAMSGFLKVLLSGIDGDVYNVGNDNEEITMSELACLVADLFSPPAAINLIRYPNTYPADEPRRRCPDLSKIKKELGYQPRVSLQAGLRRIFVWYQAMQKTGKVEPTSM